MEDLDPPREQRGAAHAILNSLRTHGLEWDGQVLWQSDRHPAYRAAVEQLLTSRLAFRCDCSRARLAPFNGIYQGRCRERGLQNDNDTAVRVTVPAGTRVTVVDQLQESLVQDLASEVGDFVIRRRDGLYAYQLAVVLDDDAQGVTHVLRGSDLYDSTPRQIYLQRLLGLPTPAYCHIPVLVNEAGQKLSKQTGATALDNAEASQNLRSALAFLAQQLPPDSHTGVQDIIDWALQHWDMDRLPKGPSARLPGPADKRSP
jgi:glutamyl-Q tRNA(Asp) synthetase